MLFKNQALRILRRLRLNSVSEAGVPGDIGVLVDHRDVALGNPGDNQLVVDPDANHCECRHAVDVARTDPPFFPHGSDLMCCGACGLVMGQDFLIQVAHIGWHERSGGQ